LTEVLTYKGWKFFKDVTYEDRMATVNSSGQLEYNIPEQLIVNDWDGEMYKFYSRVGKIDLLVTPNHNMYVQTENSNRKSKAFGWKLETAEEVFGKSRYFKKNVEYIREDLDYITINNVNICNGMEEAYTRRIKTDDWLEFLGYYLSEGSTTITSNKHYVVQIRQLGKENLYKMAGALDKVTSNKINIRENDGRVVVNDKELAVYLKREFGNKYNKYIPQFILNTCSKRQLLILYEALMLGDGHIHKKGGGSYNTSSIKLRDNFIELLLKSGYSGSYTKVYSKGDTLKVFNRLHFAKEDNWTIYIKFKSNCPFKSKQTDFNEKKINYKGKIYCVTVKNHTLYVRRNGCSVWCGNSGYAKACRGNIMALHKLGVPLTLNSISFEQAKPELIGEEGKILGELANKNIDYNINLIHTTPEFWEKYRDNSVKNVGYTVWETDKLHKDWPDYINKNVDKVIVACEWNIEVFKNSGVTIPIGVVQHGINMNDFDNVTPYIINGVNDATYVFYSIFQWVEKKCPLSLLKAYWYMFQNNDNVALVLKTYRSDYSDREKQAIRSTIHRLKTVMPMDKYPPVYLILDMLSESEMLGLHTRGDCYVSFDRFEGFGLSPFTAGANGKPIIVTGFGGSMEYAKEDNSYLNPYTYTPVFGMPYSPWHTGDQLWGEPDVYGGAKLMKHIYENQSEANEKGLRLKKYISENFTWEHIGRKLIKEIELL